MSYRIIQTHTTDGVFNGPLLERPKNLDPLYVHYIKMNTRRSMYGIVEVHLTQDSGKAKTWATREAAERVAAKHTDDYRTYAVEEV